MKETMRSDALEDLPDFRDLRLVFRLLKRFRLSRLSVIKDSPFWSFPIFIFGSRHDITPVVTDLLRQVAIDFEMESGDCGGCALSSPMIVNRFGGRAQSSQILYVKRA
jgi:hypothetical protein